MPVKFGETLTRLAGTFFHQLDSSERLLDQQVARVNRRREELASATNEELRAVCDAVRDRATFTEDELTDVCAAAAVVALRGLGLNMFDVQIRGALSLSRGEITEMQTGEGKTLAAVPAIIWYALRNRGVHVLTANDYLAGRDAEWMRTIYDTLGLTVAHVNQDMSAAERRAAYSAQITYATANEVGFDYLRDSLARSPEELVHRPFAFAVIDECDSILIDEARIPLVIAGGHDDQTDLCHRADWIVRRLRPHDDFQVNPDGRNVYLTNRGIRRVEFAMDCGNLYDAHNLHTLTAIQDALHAHVLLRRDVDYVVKDDAVQIVDEFKGRVAVDRRWPAGLQTALEAKEHVALKRQGRILGSITIQNLVSHYERFCGMTGTAATQSEEFRAVYQKRVRVIPTNRPVIRIDETDILYADREAKYAALVREIAKVHATGRPILVGTASVEESETVALRLRLADIPHHVLNAKNDRLEAQIIAQAGALGAVTISTNMAGRGTDILLGGNPPVDRDRVVALGGLYVIGTTRHEARRIDNQLRGRAGRQGDPGSSRFFISVQDDLLVKYGIDENPDVDSVQRTAESASLEARQTLWKYESATEEHRREMHSFRRRVLLDAEWTIASMLPEELYNRLAEAVGAEALERDERRITLAVFDDLWADYLANVAELRGGIHWVNWGGRDPLYEFLKGVEKMYEDLDRLLQQEITAAFENATIENGELRFPNPERFERGATWTYLTTDQPFGTLMERMAKSMRARIQSIRN